MSVRRYALLACALLGHGCGRGEAVPNALGASAAPEAWADPRTADFVRDGSWSHPDMLARTGAQLAYDAPRGRVLLFGGETGWWSGFANDALFETWEWDGQSWVQLHPAHVPVGAAGGAMVYDAARRQVLQFGGRPDGASASTNETWAWNGQDWRRLSPAHSPPARQVTAMAYDPALQTVLLTGGYSIDDAGHATNLFDTWEWDGSDWLERHPANPPTVGNVGLAYDEVREQLVLLTFDGGWVDGTRHVDTWTWDGADWSHAAADDAWLSIAYYATGLIYDPWRKRVVLLGQVGEDASWEWDGTTWVSIDAPPKLPFGLGVAIAHDEQHQRLVAFGGWIGGMATQQTQLYDGERWTLASPERPGGGAATPMVYDEARAQTLLFGFPQSDSSIPLIWSWDGKTWASREPRMAMPWRAEQGVAYDAARGEVVLFGGGAVIDEPSAETWVFDGVDWWQVPTERQPPGRFYPVLAYDRARQVTVMFGGTTIDPYWEVSDATVLDDQWEWNGHEWSQQLPATRPSPRVQPAMAFDAARGQLVLFGGFGPDGSFLSDTWAWDGATWTQLFPAHTPAPRYQAGLVYDSARQRLLLAGGICDGSCGSWAWNGDDWTPFASAPLASGVSYLWAYDSARQQLVGYGAAGFAGAQDTWLYTADGGR